MPVWPGDPAPRQRSLQRLQDGDACDLSEWLLGSHTGAHVDAPLRLTGSEAGPARVILL
jgi:kynurenine formamidase